MIQISKDSPVWGTKVLVLGLLLAAMLAAIALTVKPAGAATTFTVNSTTDKLDSKVGDGFCLTGQAQECTLRAAIQEANATPGANAIDFHIFGTGVKTIEVNSNGNGELPTVTEQVTIDGYTQAGASPNTLARGTNAKLMIELDGSEAGVAHGLDLQTSNSVVKGLTINRFRNGHGIGLSLFATGNRIEGNFIGTGPSGTRDLGNGGDGVEISGASSNTVGGATPAARNLISGNDSDGVSIASFSGFADSADNKILGNLIGTERDGVTALGNGADGVSISGIPSVNTIVGGAKPASANTIAFNRLDGVGIDDGASNRVLRNSIHSNLGQGIDLGSDGPTPNDGDNPNTPQVDPDGDIGPNGFQNFPVLTSAKTSSAKTTVSGKLNSTPGETFKIQFFSNPSGNEGKKFIGQKLVSTNTNGNAAVAFSPARSVPVGQTITATATSVTEGTSEFSAPRKVVTS